MRDDFILEFKIEPKNEWKIFSNSILFYCGAVFGFIYYSLTKNSLGLFLGVGSILPTIPQILIHIQYKLKDRKKKIIVNHSKKTIKFIENEKSEIEFEFKDIKKIIRHKGQNDEDNTWALPTFFYNYTEIVLNNGKSVFFTDFISKTIGLRNIELEEKQSLFNVCR